MEENDVKEIFSPFGEIINMDMIKDELSRSNRGYAYIEYKTAKVLFELCSQLFLLMFIKQANDASTSMNKFELCGRQLRIGKAIAPPFELGGKKVSLLSSFIFQILF